MKEGGGGNREEEIVGSHAIQIANAVNYTTGTAPTGPKEVRHVIGGNVTKILSGTDTKQVNGGNSNSAEATVETAPNFIPAKITIPIHSGLFSENEKYVYY